MMSGLNDGEYPAIDGTHFSVKLSSTLNVLLLPWYKSSPTEPVLVRRAWNNCVHTSSHSSILSYRSLSGFSFAGGTVPRRNTIFDLASRCGVDHLVWATRNEMSRYKKTNWAGAKHCVYPWGWDPRPSKVSRALKGWISSGKFLKL